MRDGRYQINAASYCFLQKDNRILLLRRKNTKYQDGKYGLPSGHLEEGEKPSMCLVREIKEEVNVVIKDPEFVGMVFNTTDGLPHYANFFFKVTDWEGEVKNLEPDKCDDIKWVSLDSLPKHLTPEVDAAFKFFKSGEFYTEI